MCVCVCAWACVYYLCLFISCFFECVGVATIWWWNKDVYIDARTTFPLHKKERERRSRAFPSDSNPGYSPFQSALHLVLTHSAISTGRQLSRQIRHRIFFGVNRKSAEKRFTIYLWNIISFKTLFRMHKMMQYKFIFHLNSSLQNNQPNSVSAHHVTLLWFMC